MILFKLSADSVGDYEPPFHGMVGQDPSFEEMRKIVVVDRMSPAIPEHWRNNDVSWREGGREGGREGEREGGRVGFFMCIVEHLNKRH